MSFENLVGLHVINEESYNTYREKMRPILESYGGSFGYDFTIAQTLLSQVEHEINRLFVIRFPDKETSQRFFSDEAYKEVRKAHFEPAVEGVSILASFVREGT